jgi:predicted nucleic acid-binding protein
VSRQAWDPATTWLSSQLTMGSSSGERGGMLPCAAALPRAAWPSGCSKTGAESPGSKVRFCLDSWAVLAWLDGEEPAAEAVARAMEGGRPAMSWVNLIEVHYSTARDHGRSEADEVLAELRPQISEDLPGISAMRAVARLKAEHPIALADCFAIALAAAEGVVLLTGDPEIIEAPTLPCEVQDLRQPQA